MMERKMKKGMLGSTELSIVPEGGFSFEIGRLQHPVPYSEEGSMWLFCRKCGGTFPLVPNAIKDMRVKAGVSSEKDVQHELGMYFEVSDCEQEYPSVSLVEV